jgi:hypothetical protein
MCERFYELRQQLEELIRKRINGGGRELVQEINQKEREINYIKRQKHLLNSDLGPVYCLICGGFFKANSRIKKYYTKANCEECAEHEGLEFQGTRLERLCA